MGKVFTTVHHVQKSLNNNMLMGEHFFMKCSPSIHLFTFKELFF